MTIYETDNQEIIDYYNLYIEVKTFILKFENLKQLFKEHYNLKQKKNCSYLVFDGCASSYQNFLKVYKVFMSGIDQNEYQKYLNLCQIYNNIFYISFLNGHIYEKIDNSNNFNYKLNNCSPNDIFRNIDIKILKNILKLLIKSKLLNINIEKI